MRTTFLLPLLLLLLPACEDGASGNLDQSDAVYEVTAGAVEADNVMIEAVNVPLDLTVPVEVEPALVEVNVAPAEVPPTQVEVSSPLPAPVSSLELVDFGEVPDAGAAWDAFVLDCPGGSLLWLNSHTGATAGTVRVVAAVSCP